MRIANSITPPARRFARKTLQPAAAMRFDNDNHANFAADHDYEPAVEILDPQPGQPEQPVWQRFSSPYMTQIIHQEWMSDGLTLGPSRRAHDIYRQANENQQPMPRIARINV